MTFFVTVFHCLGKKKKKKENEKFFVRKQWAAGEFMLSGSPEP